MMETPNWKDIFKGYPKELVKGAFMGMIETTKVVIAYSKADGNDKYVRIFSDTLKQLEKDLEDINNEKGTV